MWLFFIPLDWRATNHAVCVDRAPHHCQASTGPWDSDGERRWRRRRCLVWEGGLGRWEQWPMPWYRWVDNRARVDGLIYLVVSPQDAQMPFYQSSIEVGWCPKEFYLLFVFVCVFCRIQILEWSCLWGAWGDISCSSALWYHLLPFLICCLVCSVPGRNVILGRTSRLAWLHHIPCSSALYHIPCLELNAWFLYHSLMTLLNTGGCTGCSYSTDASSLWVSPDESH